MIKKSKENYKIALDNIKKCFYNGVVSCEKAIKKLTANPRKVHDQFRKFTRCKS